MSNFNFTSQVCTTREQSQRLMDLGLKPETADMSILTTPIDCVGVKYLLTPYSKINYPKVFGAIPAWSLHRLMEILDSPLIEFNTLTYNPYEEIIDLISECLKLKCITNKEYLKQ